MALHLSLLLLLLIFDRLSAVRHVSVQTGGSITFPCRYDLNHINHVKYWCQGLGWDVCSYVVRTDHPKSSGKTSISDDINKRIFTVTMTDLASCDYGNYRCVVEINRGTDIMIHWFYLSVTPGTPELYVEQQEVTGVEGGSVTVCCYYSNSGDMKWCRMGGDCVSGFSGTLHGTSVTLTRTSDANNRKALTVTMSGLKMENTDWYWCRVGELEMPVHITVSQQTATQRTSKMTSTTQDPTPQQPSASPTAEPVQTDNTSQGAEGNMEEVHQSPHTTRGIPSSIRSIDVKVLLISLGMLVVVTAGILVTWKMWRRPKDNKAKDQTTNNSVPADPEQDITYSTVTHTRETAQQSPNPERRHDVMYSTMMPDQFRTEQKDPFPEADDDVTYSTVIPQHKTQLKGQTKSAEPDDHVVYSSLALQVTTQQREAAQQ
ncbi:polymeric immunoglobulin receptor-like isoform X2 [Oncorhynchus nerka]|uniref:polymeric immunoglobulin receptor-like isoform X2 n=1 Tax=Oncorhynchus nerka TaxID=8023 RepID=UPI0011327F68|nr:polymeric immunoglobulin receptor-like isoform X2 [Oncorhynchus nerka]